MNLIVKLFKFTKKSRYSEDITLEDMNNMLKINKDIILLDVRSPQEYIEGHMVGAINIPLYELCANINYKIPNKKTTIIAYCKTGARSRKGVKILKKCGYQSSYNLNSNFN